MNDLSSGGAKSWSYQRNRVPKEYRNGNYILFCFIPYYSWLSSPVRFLRLHCWSQSWANYFFTNWIRIWNWEIDIPIGQKISRFLAKIKRLLSHQEKDKQEKVIPDGLTSNVLMSESKPDDSLLQKFNQLLRAIHFT